MGRCGWGVGIAFVLAMLGASCGGTGGGPSDSGEQFVFTARGRLILSAQTVGSGVSQGCQPSPIADPKRLLLTATLLDPQGVPFRNQSITFTAEFPDATFIPGDDNEGSVLTDNSGQATIMLVAGLTVGKMRVVANASVALNISTGITVTLTQQGFVSQGDLGIIPSEVTFVNPAPHPPGGPADIIFQATGGKPPYKFSNSNPSVGKIETTGTCGSLGQYALTGPLPTEDNEARTDTVTIQDAGGSTAQAKVQVLFTTCSLNVSPTTINIGGAVGGERADIKITNGVPPFTATHAFPDAGDLLIDQSTGTVTFVVATPPIGVDPDTILIRDSRNCSATVEVTVTPKPAPKVTTIVMQANPTSINGPTGGSSVITATVLDENNKLMPNISVLFQIEPPAVGSLVGNLSAITAITGTNGQATVTLTIPAKTPAGTVTVTGSARGVSGSVDVTLTAGGGGGGGGPTPASVQFVSAAPTVIGVKGSGLPEQSILTFQVTDALGQPIVGAAVHFSLTSLGGEFLAPLTGISDSKGFVQVVVTSGTRAIDVHVTAAIDTNGDGQFDVVTQFTPVTIVGAPPVQGSLSLARGFANIAGQVTFGLQDNVTAFLRDRFGNPVPQNTAVLFTTNGGSITGQGLTNNQGQATSPLVSQAPVPPEGLVVALVASLGEEPFIDNNGNGIFDTGDTILNDSVPEPFIDHNGNCKYDPGDPFETFIDTNHNGVWDAVQGTPGVWDNHIFVWATVPVIFSGPTAASVSCFSGSCAGSSFTIPDGGSATFEILANDVTGNPLTSNSLISISIAGAGKVTSDGFSIVDATNCATLACADDPLSFDATSCGAATNGLTRFLFTVFDDQPGDSDPPKVATVTVEIKSPTGGSAPGGNGSVKFVLLGTID
ncbi:MAG: Ig-like domain-containing protein [Deltaproteobacteria bacterium]|nr:Ig-like domain-containing protein [Deltaproteobacteria bacterium]